MFSRSASIFPVAGGLVEHIDEIAVFQNVLDLRGGKQIFGVLCRPGRHAAPLSEPFPNLGAVRCGLFLLQQKVELIHEIPGRPADGPVDGDGVPHRVLDNEHTGLFQVLAQALDVKADKAVADVHGGAVVKEVQRTVHIQVQRLSYPSASGMPCARSASIKSPRMGIFSGLGSAK